MAEQRDRCEVVRVSPATPTGCENPSHRILLVEDDEDSGIMLRFLLELAGHDVRLARGAAEGLALAASWCPEVVISDLTLPGELDGCAIARALRADPRYRAAFLVALSGLGRDCDKARARAAGFDSYLTKPVDLEALEAAVAQVPAAEGPDDDGQEDEQGAEDDAQRGAQPDSGPPVAHS